MANAQKRGFRFPWEGDSSSSESADPEIVDADAAPDPAAIDSTLAEDLGTGPFDLRAAAMAAVAGTDTDEENTPVTAETEPAPSGLEATATDRDADAQSPEAAPGTWPDVDRRRPGRPFMTGGAQAEDAPDAAPATTGAKGSGTVDAASPTTASSPSTGSSRSAARASLPPVGRRDNPLVAGLVRAMRDAARVARDEAVAQLRADATTYEEAIRTRSNDNVAELRKVAEGDVAAIRDWSKGELARVREETDQRISARRAQLVTDTETEAAAGETRLQRLAKAIEAYEAETQEFFETLLAVDDPARLAGLAEQLPSPPELEDFASTPAAEAQDVPAEATANDAPGGATSEATGEPIAQADGAAEDQPIGESEPVATDAAAATEAGPNDGHLDADAAAAAEAESRAGLDGHTQLRVSGLSGVASIAGFKAELLRIPGVSAVSVATADSGEFQFTVTHAADADVRAGIEAMTSFDARLAGDTGEALIVVAQIKAA